MQSLCTSVLKVLDFGKVDVSLWTFAVFLNLEGYPSRNREQRISGPNPGASYVPISPSDTPIAPIAPPPGLARPNDLPS